MRTEEYLYQTGTCISSLFSGHIMKRLEDLRMFYCAYEFSSVLTLSSRLRGQVG